MATTVAKWGKLVGSAKRGGVRCWSFGPSSAMGVREMKKKKREAPVDKRRD